MLLQRLDDISETYLQGLCSDGTMESQTLDFKLELSKADDKRELHKDLCAFANAEGGDLVYGIAQDAGIAAKIVPVNTASIDALRRRIAQAADSIEPRLLGVRVHEVSVSDGHVVIVRVPASFDGPHSFRVDGGARRFVLRNGTDTTEMNFDQIRTAFDRTASLGRAGALKSRQFPSSVPCRARCGSETSSAQVWCCLLPCSWSSRSLCRSRSRGRRKNETELQAEKQSKGRGVPGGMRTRHCREVTDPPCSS